MVGRFLTFAIRHKGGLIRTDRQDVIHQIMERIAFDVVLGLRVTLHQISQGSHVRCTDMALIGTRMHSQTGSAGLERDFTEFHGRRIAVVTSIADQSDLIEIDGQFRLHNLTSFLI